MVDELYFADSMLAICETGRYFRVARTLKASEDLFCVPLMRMKLCRADSNSISSIDLTVTFFTKA